jgi:hypothetical protein
MTKPQLVKIQIAAEFVLPDGEHLEPGVYGPVQMTAREWAEFDLQAAIEAGVAQARQSQGFSQPNSQVPFSEPATN